MSIITVDGSHNSLAGPESDLLSWVKLNFAHNVAKTIEGVLRGTIPDTSGLLSTDDHRIRQEAGRRGVKLPQLRIFRGENQRDLPVVSV